MARRKRPDGVEDFLGHQPIAKLDEPILGRPSIDEQFKNETLTPSYPASIPGGIDHDAPKPAFNLTLGRIERLESSDRALKRVLSQVVSVRGVSGDQLGELVNPACISRAKASAVSWAEPTALPRLSTGSPTAISSTPDLLIGGWKPHGRAKDAHGELHDGASSGSRTRKLGIGKLGIGVRDQTDQDH